MTENIKAYSYLRISTDQQKVGDGVRRQLEATKAYADQHGYELVQSMEDIGVSAFKGKNATDGALGLFIAAMDAGKIEAGSVLIVENLDRLSRSKVLDAFAQFTNILNKGVGIVTLTDGQYYTAESVNENMGQLFLSLGGMLRAHEESVVKSKRVGAAWKRKRENIGDKLLTKNVPSWLTIADDQQTILVDENKANTVREIFRLSSAGMGAYTITQQFNADPDKYPIITAKGKIWQVGFIQSILQNPAVYGMFQPHHTVDGKRVPVGDPVENYFPEVISKELFDLVQARRSARSVGAGKGAGRKGATVSNLFSGLIICGSCGANVTARKRYDRNKKSHSYLRCTSSTDKQGCNCGGWDYDDFEAMFIKFIREIKFSEIFANEDTHNEARNLEILRGTASAKLIELNTSLSALLKQFESDDLPDSLRRRLIERSVELEASIDASRREIEKYDNALAELNTRDRAEEQVNFLAQYDELIKTNDKAKLKEKRSALAGLLSRNIHGIVIYNDFKMYPWEAEDLVSDKLRLEISKLQRARYGLSLEDYFSSSVNMRRYVESERYVTVEFKSGAVRVIHPYENKTYMSVSERMAAFRKGRG